MSKTKTKLNFPYIYQVITAVANCVFAKKDKKEMVRETLLNIVAYSCVAYANDPSFKNQIDRYIENQGSPNPK